MKNLLIVGGNSMLALMWLKYLKNDFNIFATEHKKKINLNNITIIKIKNDFRNSIERLLIKHNIEFIINCAGLTSVEECEVNPEKAYEINSEIPLAIAKITAKSNIKFIQISTDHLFDGKEDIFYGEDAETCPQNVYAKSKLIGESISKFDSNSLILRTNFFGLSLGEKNSFSDKIIMSLSKNRNIALFKDVRFTPVHVSTLNKCFKKLLEIDANGVYNISCSQNISKLEFGHLIANKFGFDASKIDSISINSKPNLIQRPKNMSLKNEKISKIVNSQILSINHQIDVLYEEFS